MFSENNKKSKKLAYKIFKWNLKSLLVLESVNAIHRDIKPDNIMIDLSKNTDFY